MWFSNPCFQAAECSSSCTGMSSQESARDCSQRLWQQVQLDWVLCCLVGEGHVAACIHVTPGHVAIANAAVLLCLLWKCSA